MNRLEAIRARVDALDPHTQGTASYHDLWQFIEDNIPLLLAVAEAAQTPCPCSRWLRWLNEHSPDCPVAQALAPLLAEEER